MGLCSKQRENIILFLLLFFLHTQEPTVEHLRTFMHSLIKSTAAFAAVVLSESAIAASLLRYIALEYFFPSCFYSLLFMQGNPLICFGEDKPICPQIENSKPRISKPWVYSSPMRFNSHWRDLYWHALESRVVLIIFFHES